jgi:hypothetical protein
VSSFNQVLPNWILLLLQENDTQYKSVTRAFQHEFPTHKRQTPLCVDDDTSTDSPTLMKKHVSFSTVAVRDYDITIGDSPSVSSGIPLSLDWTFVDDTLSWIDDHEINRFGQRRRCFLLSAEQRRRKLMECFGVDGNRIRRTAHRRQAISGKCVGNKAVFIPIKKYRQGLGPSKRSASDDIAHLGEL